MKIDCALSMLIEKSFDKMLAETGLIISTKHCLSFFQVIHLIVIICVETKRTGHKSENLSLSVTSLHRLSWLFII